VDLERLGNRYGCDLRALHAAAWERGEAAGIVESEGGRVRLTAGGRLRSNELFADLL
jgi:coproporphyrinogen III oxidase-like Fe-S oxidoreductase